MTITKRGKLTILGVLSFIVMMLIGVSFYRSSNSGDPNLKEVPVQGVDAIADYHLIPIIDTQAQSADLKQVYLNTEATPSLFFATWSDQSKEVVTAVQDKLSKMGSDVHKPLILVSTFVKSTDQGKALAEAKTFQEKSNVTLPIAVQVGTPTEFVKQVPSLVYMDQGGAHIVTDEQEILDLLDTVLALPSSQSSTPEK